MLGDLGAGLYPRLNFIYIEHQELHGETAFPVMHRLVAQNTRGPGVLRLPPPYFSFTLKVMSVPSLLTRYAHAPNSAPSPGGKEISRSLLKSSLYAFTLAGGRGGELLLKVKLGFPLNTFNTILFVVGPEEET